MALAAKNTLTKGANIALPEGVCDITVGLSWEAPSSNYDLDAWTFLLGESGKVASDANFVFFGNLTSPCGSVVAGEDNQAGGSDDEDDETVSVNLSKVPASVSRIVFIVNIYEAKLRSQTFGDLDNASIRLMDSSGVELARYNLSQGDVSTEASLIFGELYRHKGAWKFRAIAQGNANGPAKLVREFGVEVDDDPEPQPASVVAAPVQPTVPAINLSKGKIELTKPGAKVNIAKTKAMEFSLYWTKPRKDLGLILHVAYDNGKTAYIDWRKLKDDRGAVHHHGDRVAGGSDIREHATLRFDQDSSITAVAVIAYSEVSNGVGSFKSMGAHAVIDDGEGTVVTVDLNKGGTFSYHTLIAVAVVNSDGSLRIERASRFSAQHSEKRPEIDKYGGVSMNTGPVVFK